MAALRAVAAAPGGGEVLAVLKATLAQRGRSIVGVWPAVLQQDDLAEAQLGQEMPHAGAEDAAADDHCVCLCFHNCDRVLMRPGKYATPTL